MSNRLTPWAMWTFPLVFFGFQFVLRLFPGLVMNEFLDKYNITASDFGLFASLYYLGYASMQIPVAIMLDKYGPKRVISLSVILAGVSVWIMVLFDSWIAALTHRLLLGASTVVGFLGTSKVISQWFSKDKFAKMVGLTFSFGLLGALYGGRPTSLLIEEMGWNKVLMLLGVVALTLGVLIFLFVKDNKEDFEETPSVIQSLKHLITYKPLILLSLGNFLMVGALEGFADVWGVPYLMESRGLTKVDSASLVSFVFFGMLFGGPILAHIAEKYSSYHGVAIASGILMAALLSILIRCNNSMSSYAVGLVLFLVGVLCCYQVIVFSIGAKLVPAGLLSITTAFLNCINMLGGSFFHNAIGKLMDYFDSGHLADFGVYSVSTFNQSLMLIPLTSALGALLVYRSYRSSMSTEQHINYLSAK